MIQPPRHRHQIYTSWSFVLDFLVILFGITPSFRYQRKAQVYFEPINRGVIILMELLTLRMKYPLVLVTRARLALLLENGSEHAKVAIRLTGSGWNPDTN